MELTSDTPHFLGILLALTGFFAGFALSEYFSRKKTKGEKDNGRDSAAYLKGINYILTNEPDKAIEAFSQAVQINSDTVETYMALGNLFRNKGEISRAIRIHQSIILRPNLDKKTKLQGHYDLSLDFKKAGFMERAINSFEEVVAMDSHFLDAHLHLLELYEDTREWEKAYAAQSKISKLRKTNDNHVLAHHMTELGKIQAEQGHASQAKKSFKKAISLSVGCVDAYLHLGDLLSQEGAGSKAISTWRQVMEISPALTYLVYPRLEEAYFKLNQFDKMEETLRENSRKNYYDIHTHLAFADYLYKKSMVEEATKELKTVLELKPNHLEARRELGKYYMEQGQESEAVAVYSSFFESYSSPEKNFQCSECGYESRELLWRCPQCRKWDKIDEKPLSTKGAGR